MHVGGVRTALFAWLLARQSPDGVFILRLEDTDQKREVEGSAQHIVTTLQELGLNYDEGPDVDGGHGPYRQSERLDIYKKWAEKLIEQGRAYADPYTPEEIQAFRDQAQAEKRAFLYRHHRPDSADQRTAWDGTTPLRFKSDPKYYTWHDEVMGELSTGPEVIDDFILIKSDGFPTYNFAHIVDDAEMAVTHIIRGQEFISSQPNYLNLYEALGFDMTTLTAKHEAQAELQGVEQASEFTSEAQRRGRPLPKFATVPHILAPTGGKKLGKRDGAKDVLDYLSDGYTPEALLNFIASLGWNDGTEQEVFTVDELIEKFSLDRVQKSGARFDEQRLLWLNGQHIRQLELDDLYERVAGFWPAEADEASQDLKKQLLALVQDRLKTFRDLPLLTRYFFTEPTPDWDLITTNKQLKKLSTEERTTLLQIAHDAFEATEEWTPDTIQQTLNTLLETTGQKPGILFSLIRIVTTWAPFSPQLNDTLAILGKETVLHRIKKAL